MTKEEKLLYKRIDEIIWKEWDPIGVNEFEEPRDEYYSYLPEIFRMKISKVEKHVIVEYLLKIEIERMGLDGNIENCQNVAEKIISL